VDLEDQAVGAGALGGVKVAELGLDASRLFGVRMRGALYGVQCVIYTAHSLLMLAEELGLPLVGRPAVLCGGIALPSSDEAQRIHDSE